MAGVAGVEVGRVAEAAVVVLQEYFLLSSTRLRVV
jgi:hypothetical protein